MERLGYAKGIPEQAQRWVDAGEHEDFDAVYDLKKTLRFVRFVLERVPDDPDDIAELVEALKVARNRLYGIDTARNRGFDLHYAEGSARAGVREIDAVLARVKGGAK
jgi:hypothetical protein